VVGRLARCSRVTPCSPRVTSSASRPSSARRASPLAISVASSGQGRPRPRTRTGWA
jgi:hypothetical protein